MNNLFLLAVHNTVLALGFAVFVYGLTRVWRSPPVAHALWVLVLLKLAAPPVMRVDWRALPLPGSTHARGWVIPDVARIEGQTAENDPRFPDRPAAKTAGQTPDLNVNAYDFAASLRLLWDRGRAVLPWVWLGGGVLCVLVAATRIVRFERLLRDTLPASERLQRRAFELAVKLGVHRVPEVRYVECAGVPLLWCAGRRALDFDRLLVESARVGGSAADSPVRGPLLRRVGPVGIPRMHETLRRDRAQDGGVAKRVAGWHVAAAGQPVSAFAFTEKEDRDDS